MKRLLLMYKEPLTKPQGQQAAETGRMDGAEGTGERAPTAGGKTKEHTEPPGPCARGGGERAHLSQTQAPSAVKTSPRA